jgi:hypothetical protein
MLLLIPAPIRINLIYFEPQFLHSLLSPLEKLIKRVHFLLDHLMLLTQFALVQIFLLSLKPLTLIIGSILIQLNLSGQPKFSKNYLLQFEVDFPQMLVQFVCVITDL